MFKAKSERFDVVFLGISNLLKTYTEFIEKASESGDEASQLITNKLGKLAFSKMSRLSTSTRTEGSMAERQRNESIATEQGLVGDSDKPLAPKEIEKVLKQKRLVFKCIIDIRDAIISQLTDKVSVIPFCIR